MKDIELETNFFFKRDKDDRDSGNRFFLTIIRQLIKKIVELNVLVTNIINSNLFIFDKVITEQFRRLVL